MGRAEYIIIMVLLLSGALMVPAYREVQFVHDAVLSICAGLGIR